MNNSNNTCKTILAIDILDRLGNREPTQLQIDIVESHLVTISKLASLRAQPKLTVIEVRILYLVAKGKNTTEIGQLVSTGPQAVICHKKEIKRKLNAASMAEAVFKGIQLGYITQNN